MAQQLEMANGTYVYLAVEMFSSPNWGFFTPIRKDKDDSVAVLGFASLLLFTLATNAKREVEVFNSQVVKNSAKNYNYTYAPGEEVDVVVSHFYDSVIYYASLVRDMTAAGEDHKNADRMLERAVNYTFFSPVNGVVGMDENGDRKNSFKVRNFNPATGRFEDFLSLPAGTSDVLRLGMLLWPNGTELPQNRPACGYLGNDHSCRQRLSKGLIAAAIIIPLLVVSGLILAAVMLAKRFLKSDTNPFWWRVLLSEVTVVNKNRISSRITGSVVPEKSKRSLLTNAETATIMSTKEILARDVLTVEAIYQGNSVDLRLLDKPNHRATPMLRTVFDTIKRLQHPNLQIFIGIAVDDEQLCKYVVGEFCSKGTLMQLLERTSFNLDWEFKSSLLKDIASGMGYLHASRVISHGYLTAYTCRIDSNFVLKIIEHGLHTLRNTEYLHPPSEYDEERDYELLLWRSPELLRRTMPPEGTQKGDVYSFAILLQQIILRSPPFRSNFVDHRADGDALTDKEVVIEVKKGTVPPLRPRVPVSSCPSELHDLLERCWDESAMMRPTFPKIREALLKQMGKAGDSIIEHLIDSMEKHAAGLELEAENKMRLMVDEKKRSDDILCQMLPPSIALALTQGKHPEPETFASTTVHFSDIEGFVELIAEAKTPKDTVHILNTLYSVSDSVIEKYDVYKVETVKDAYMIVSGLPVRNGINHADNIATMALQMRREIAGMVVSNHEHSPRLRLRVGIHSGPCVAGIIGTKMPRYCLFGDTVNTSSRMESHGEAGKIQCSNTTKALLDQIGGFILIGRGEINIKGKGLMETYWIIAKDQ
ncbi:Atrial natriuretic peptide receptor 1 [Hypsibius exemplaris]|uniref:Guanylate cyclase n=1 Tax=Hypsibius exemplaris TaxID=2072580 RepID=A0A9X6NIM0_HYPEX|nr:Atrial natriuretic peptide receptor 1 [Hypsibius exemplaris]